jgi:hypothetical protein
MLVALFALVSGTALAHPTPDGWGEDDRHFYRPPPAALVIPETYAGVVAELGVRATAAESALTASKILDLHRATEALTRLADALPMRALAMKTDQQKTVGEKSADLRQQTEKFRAAADAGDVAAARAVLPALRADIDALAKLAP